jgi:hypothetical protein
MQITKAIAVGASTVVLALVLSGCTGGQKVEAPQPEHVEKKLVPATARFKADYFSADLTDLKVAMTVDPTSKEIVEAPKLLGDIKIVNTSENIIDIQRVSLGYRDKAGKVIPFESGEKVAKLTSYWKTIKPNETFEGSIDAMIPRTAVEKKKLGKILIEMVYIPSPVKRESLSIIGRIE